MQTEHARRWYVVHTKPRQEVLALSHLVRQAYESYLPMITERRRHKGRYQLQSVPMFPRYLFVRMDTAIESTAPIRSTIGCCGLVRFGTELAQLADPVVDTLRANENGEGAIAVNAPEWRVGESVRIIEGPFCGMDARFFSRSGSERVLVLMELLGGEQQVELPEYSLVPVGA